MEHAEITKKIIGAAYKVYNILGPGFLESVYEQCILIELKKAGLHTESQKSLKVFYDGQIVGNFTADLIVENCIIVELKVVRQLSKIHEAQLVNYLVSTGKDIGLLISFGSEKVQIKRKFRIYENEKGSQDLQDK